jgi:hypothetical protein
VNSLPNTLIDFRRQLEDAITQDLGRRPRARSLLVRSAVVLAAAGSVVAWASIAGVFDGPAPTVVERASAALTVKEGTILHVTIVGRQNNGDGTQATWRDESWQSTSAPYERRQVEQVSDDPIAETSSVGDAEALYDAKTHTVYLRNEPAALPASGKVLRWKNGEEKPQRVIVSGGRPAPPKTQNDPMEEPFRREVLELLRSGDAREMGRVTLAGRQAIRIVGNGGNATYFVDPKSYNPIEFRTVGNGGSTSLRFVVYETLPLSTANRALLDVRAQHPGASVNDDPAAFQAAQSRLFPHG